MPEFIQPPTDTPRDSGSHATMTIIEGTLAIVLLVGGFLWWQSSHKSPVARIQLNRGSAAPVETATPTGGLGSRISSGIENPGEKAPSTNPFDATTNPFSAYENPFK